MAKKAEMTEMLGFFFIIIVALTLIPTITNASIEAQYGLTETEYHIIDASADNTTTLTQDGYIYNVTGFIVIVLDQANYLGRTTLTWLTDYKVTTIGDYSTGAVITFYNMNKTITDFNASISFHYRLPAAQYTLLGLVPLFWVITIIAACVVVVTKKLKMW